MGVSCIHAPAGLAGSLMPNTDSPAAAAPESGRVVPHAKLHELHEQEIVLLRDTIGNLLQTIQSQAVEKDVSASFTLLIRQLRAANQHLVLATFGAQDRQAAAEATALKQNEFLSMLAHELRNPLQPLAMANELLEDLSALHPTLERVHAINSRQIGHLVRLVDDLLDASRLSNGKFTLQLAPVRVNDIITSAVETSQPGIARRHQQLRVTLPATALVVQGDMVRLSQALSNLLINASKFTPESGHIAIAAKRNGTAVEISVTDDGGGIALEFQPRVFDLFTQGFRSLDRAQGGLGIGLSLVRTIAELHHGQIGLFSAGLGQGSTFTLTLPLSTLAPEMAPAPGPGGEVRPCNILLIEDNHDALEILAFLLREAGHTVTCCGDGVTGLRCGLDGRFDIVICDIGLPGLDGFQVVSALRAAMQPPLPCFVAASGYGDTDQVSRAIETGFDHYLIKPISMAVLSRIIAVATGDEPPAAPPLTPIH